MRNLIDWFRQWRVIRKEIRGYKIVLRECKKVNRILDRIERLHKNDHGPEISPRPVIKKPLD